MDARKAFAENLRQQRTKRGLSQMALGNAAGLHFSEVSLLERGGRDPRLSTIAKLAKGLGIAPKDLLEGLEGID